jgi:hypothetical protein
MPEAQRLREEIAGLYSPRLFSEVDRPWLAQIRKAASFLAAF